MGAATQVPLLSFAVTDPTFSEQEYPYFLRIAHSDAVQMRAIGSLVAMYGWREVVAIHVDDDCGRSGAAALGDALKPLGINVLKKVGIRADSNRTSIDYILNDLSTMESRVFIVHMPQNLSLVFFSEARYQV
jgi:ionotropic glutamate receptor